ncbi:hypothetical protein ACP4OV_028204 [Aristida adscensionis]
MRGQMPERKKSHPRLAAVRVGRSPAASSPSQPSRRRGSGSGSGGNARRLRTPVRPPAQGRSRREGGVLARCASEPALWYAARVHAAPSGLPPSPPPPVALDRPHTCYDLFAPDSPFGRSGSAAPLPKTNPLEEAKVVVSVTVEGSAGPVKAMVRLGASVGEAIAAVVERYAREGRSPRLDPAAAEGFQLHHSHFCLESLKKNDKIGDVGGRSFYLHRNDVANGLYFQNEEPEVNYSGSEIARNYEGQLSSVPYHYQVFTIVIKKLDRLGRRTKRIWRFITCNNCT